MLQILAVALLISGTLSVLAALPQLYQLLRLKRSDEFNLFSWATWLIYQVIAVFYTIAIKKPVYVAINSLWVLFYAAMVWLILKYRIKPSKRKSSKGVY